ncbi:MAG: hypothetical protein M1830_010250 [Pleopsidium flavum]|nr:MAG: hypothetical protein M1830_010250 [Pleopsidium flavum]
MAPRIHRNRTHPSDSGSTSGYSDSSDQSRSTAPTVYSVRPAFKHFETVRPKLGGLEPDLSPNISYDARSSTETYASTVLSEEDLSEDIPEYDVPETSDEVFASNAVPSTPSDFAELFPSTRRLNIKHDDATLDGNMNLRVDTEAHTSGGRKLDLTLFHLRMHDLRHREFSLRRYCRESGREVCHSSRKVAKPTLARRPTIQRSVTTALSSIRSKSDNTTATASSMKRRDSGYDSTFDDDEEDVESSRPSSTGKKITPKSKNTIRLEFSNYAHVDVKAHGARASKRYEFEFWGINYAWKRIARRDGKFKEISYHLVNLQTGKPVAYIVPETLTTAEAEDEEAKGGWVTPCSMWISDEKVLRGVTDVADVIVATGLIALVDDSIHRHWHSKRGMHLTLPMPMKSAFKTNIEYVGPKRLIDEVFNRRGITGTRHSIN